MIDKEKLNKLAKLRSGNQVARFLMSQGIKGKPYNPYHCPIAKYLDNGARLTVKVTGQDIYDGTEYVITPLAIAIFINKFDNHKYPELIDYGITR